MQRNDDDPAPAAAAPAGRPLSLLSFRQQALQRLSHFTVLVFLAQVILVYVIVCTCLYNLTVYPDSSNSKLWTVLLSSSFGVLLPNPTLKRKNVPDAPQQ